MRKVLPVRVAIMGDGVAGRTLCRLLKMRGLEAELYGKKMETKCGIKPCGFGVSASCVSLVTKLGILPKEYVLRRDDYIIINGRRTRGDLYWIDKPKLLKAITAGVQYDEPELDSYDLIVDATGIARAYSPPIPYSRDKIGLTYQHRVITNSEVTPGFDAVRGGFLWVIPLGKKEAHVGGGSVLLPPNEIKRMVQELVDKLKPAQHLCSCSESVRISGPIFPAFHGKVITTGESAGLVVPFGAAGIHTALESAIILADKIYQDDVSEYDQALRGKFGWLSDVRVILDELEKGHLSFLRIGTAYRALRYQGLRPTLSDLLHIRKTLIEANS
jgi:flavin-dependent dehydrogenase